MKHITILSALLCILTACNTPAKDVKETPANEHFAALSTAESALCDSLQFDKEIAQVLKDHSGAAIKRLPGIDAETGEILNSVKGAGICMVSTGKQDYDLIASNKPTFAAKGYLIFMFEDDQAKEYIAVIKGKDELDIIDWRKSNGINHGHDTKDLIAKFKGWKQKDDFWVTTVGLDLVEIRFKQTLQNADEFAKEVYEFCPDAIDQGAGNMPMLVRGIKEMNGMFFWWD